MKIACTHFCDTHGPSVLFLSRLVARTGASAEAAAKDDEASEDGAETTCIPCSAFPAGGYETGLTQDLAVRSTRRPPASLYARFRTAAVRSLSCEFTPGVEGPMLFSDGISGAFVSYAFKLPDFDARGGQRWYGFLVAAADAGLLVSSWDFVTQALHALVTDLRHHAQQTYTKAKQKAPAAPSVSQTTPKWFALGLRAAARGGGARTLRSLLELVGDPHVFVRLHANLASLLHSVVTSYAAYRLPLDWQLPVPHMPEITELSASGSLDRSGEFRTLHQLRRALGAAAMDAFVVRVGAGDRVVAVGDDRLLLESLLRCLASLVPEDTEPPLVFPSDVDAALSTLSALRPFLAIRSSQAHELRLLPGMWRIDVRAHSASRMKAWSLYSYALVPPVEPQAESCFRADVCRVMDGQYGEVDEATEMALLRHRWLHAASLWADWQTRAVSDRSAPLLLDALALSLADLPVLSRYLLPSRSAIASAPSRHALRSSFHL